jgi:hypothetical protein
LLLRGCAAVAFGVLGACGALVAASTGCSSSTTGTTKPVDGGTDSVTCAAGFLGDGGAPAIELEVLQSDGTVVPVVQGDTVPLEFPPQGGQVIFVGIRATNVESCALQLTGALRDLATQEVRVDSRTIDLLPTGDGWGVSGMSGMASAANFANVPVCPNEWSSTNIYGNVYGLEVTAQDTKGHTVTQKIHVTPQCSEPGLTEECLCECQAGYVLGQACSVDAGGSP